MLAAKTFRKMDSVHHPDSVITLTSSANRWFILLFAEDLVEGAKVQIRVGANTGEALEDRHELFGDISTLSVG